MDKKYILLQNNKDIEEFLSHIILPKKQMM